MIYCHRDEDRVIVRAIEQAKAWDTALRQAGVVHRFTRSV
jgi:hypothetical protein